jgi:flagellar biogenesis protein FliO
MQITQYVNVFIMTGFVLVLIVFLSFFLKKILQNKINMKNKIRLISGLSLNNKNKIYIIEAMNKKILIGTTDSQISVIHVEDFKRDDFEIVLSKSELLSEKNEEAV